MNIDILFENENILVLNKPAGLVVHADGKINEPNLCGWIMENYPELEGVGENMIINHRGGEIEINRPGIVHRIDRDTSGCILVAKNQESFENLKKQFQEKSIKKAYRTLVYENIVQDQGVIDTVIGRHPKDFRRKMAGDSARGELREAKTLFQVIERYRDGRGHLYTYLEAYPQTGRTHQIRVHLQSRGNPILADVLYKGRHKENLHMKRMALHAYKIAFTDMDGKEYLVKADLPKDFQNIFKRLVPSS